MNLCLVTNILSPHQMPLAQALVTRIGEANFRYIAIEKELDERTTLGWNQASKPNWLLEFYSGTETQKEVEHWECDSDVVFCGLREFDCFERRVAAGRLTFYMSERWFKPPFGMLRLLHPRYFRMALRFYRLLGAPQFSYLPMGVYAADDVKRMAKICSFLPQWVFSLFRLPTFVFRHSGIHLRAKLLLWGYFVESTEEEGYPTAAQRAEGGNAASNAQTKVTVGNDSTHALTHHFRTNGRFSILWVGRMLKWKRVDTLIRAVGKLLDEGCKVQLTLVGQGADEPRLRKLVGSILSRCSKPGMPSDLQSPIIFHPPVPIAKVRNLMRQSDIYVLPSDETEGWGAVVNEAMEEGCAVIATRECGSGSTMIKDGENGLLFNAGDDMGLAHCLRRLHDDPVLRLQLAKSGKESIRTLWSPGVAAERLVMICDALLSGRDIPNYSEGPLTNI